MNIDKLMKKIDEKYPNLDANDKVLYLDAYMDGYKDGMNELVESHKRITNEQDSKTDTTSNE